MKVIYPLNKIIQYNKGKNNSYVYAFLLSSNKVSFPFINYKKTIVIVHFLEVSSILESYTFLYKFQKIVLVKDSKK